MNILITSATSAIAYKLKSELAGNAIILGDYRELPSFMLKAENMIRLPAPTSASYTHEMLTLCLDNSIEKVYALREQEWSLLKQAEQLFNEYGIELVHRP